MVDKHLDTMRQRGKDSVVGPMGSESWKAWKAQAATDLAEYIHRHFNIYHSLPHPHIATCTEKCVPYAPGQNCCTPE